MKVLILCSHRYYAPYTDYVAPFIYEQMQNLKPLGCEFQVCFVRGGGLMSYLRALRNLKRQIDDFRPDLIHAHYGLCCLLANMQRKVPVVSTFHGSDINSFWIRPFSICAVRLSATNIFVAEQLYQKAGCPKNKALIVPCGVDTNVFYPKDKILCRRQLNMDIAQSYVVFSKAFTVKVKNYPLARQAIELLKSEGYQVELVELKNYTRQEVAMLLNACDCALMTSFAEGSPQFIKEAMACNCPIVSVDVGDVYNMLRGLPNCYITAYDAIEIANRIKDCINIEQRNSEERMRVEQMFSAGSVAKQILSVYKAIINTK